MSSWSELEHQFTETKLITPSLQLLSFVFKDSFIQIWSVGSDYIQCSLQETEKRRRGYPSAQSALLLLICVFLKNLFTMGILKKFLETSILYLDTFSNVWAIPESSVIQFKHGTAFCQALIFRMKQKETQPKSKVKNMLKKRNRKCHVTKKAQTTLKFGRVNREVTSSVYHSLI